MKTDTDLIRRLAEALHEYVQQDNIRQSVNDAILCVVMVSIVFLVWRVSRLERERKGSK